MTGVALIVRESSRFDLAREEAMRRGSLQECAKVLEGAASALDRARSLIDSAISAKPEQRLASTRQATLSLNSAISAARDVAEELGA